MLKYNLCAIFVMYYTSYISVFYKCYQKSLFTESIIKMYYFIYSFIKWLTILTVFFIFSAFVFFLKLDSSSSHSFKLQRDAKAQ